MVKKTQSLLICLIIGIAVAKPVIAQNNLPQDTSADASGKVVGEVLENEEILIGTIQRPPFVYYGDQDALTGFSIDLWNAIINQPEFLGKLATRYIVFSDFNEMISAVQGEKVSGAVANISITSQREEVLDYSQPIYRSGLQIAVPEKESQTALWKVIWESGIMLFITLALIILLVIAHILWFFERNISDARHDYFRDGYVGGVWDAFWWAFIIMTMGGFEKEVPHKIVSRLIAMTWIIASLFFISTLTAKITTALTVSELQTSIASYKDLVGKRVGIPKSPVAREFLGSNGIAYTQYETLEELKNALESGDMDAIIHDAPIVQYYVNNDGAGKARLAGEIFKPDEYGIIFPEGSMLKEDVDRAIIRLKESGVYENIRARYFGK